MSKKRARRLLRTTFWILGAFDGVKDHFRDVSAEKVWCVVNGEP